MRTEVNIEKAAYPFGYKEKIIFMGSCFSEHIGGKLKDRKFDVDLNPFGVIYNPVSVASGIQKLIHQEKYSEVDLFFHQGWWHSFDHHSVFSNADKELCLNNINQRLEVSGDYLRKAEYLFVTFGTARVYHQKSDGRVVSNCHQAPASLFETQLLRVGDIVRMYSLLIKEISEINKNLKWIFTVSPVRHWKNGPIGNQLSKSTLLLAVSELQSKFGQVGYFPAYEIFMDDLRDYRYYADDLLHPGNQGVEYTWKKFTDAYLKEAEADTMTTIESLIRSKNHRPRNSGSEEHISFLDKQLKISEDLSSKHPEINLKEFIDYFSS